MYYYLLVNNGNRLFPDTSPIRNILGIKTTKKDIIKFAKQIKADEKICSIIKLYSNKTTMFFPNQEVYNIKGKRISLDNLINKYV